MKTRLELVSLITNPTPNIVEIGVEFGNFTSECEGLLSEKSNFWLVDLWEEGELARCRSGWFEKHQEAYKSILTKFSAKNNFHIIKFDSAGAAQFFPNEFFDWVYIDADHRFEKVRADILAWLPKVKIGGLISGHDFHPNPTEEINRWNGVDEAVREIFGKNFKLTGEEFNQSWYSIKEQ